jgi:hypothetical protein
MKQFTYSHDFDNQGIIHYIGTRLGTAKWMNPAEIGLIRASCSEALTGSPGSPPSVPITAIVGNEVVRCVSAAKANMWFCIDISPTMKKVRPTHYTLRHYSSWDLEALRNWRFEGSNNGHDWFVLSVHVNDAALDKKGAT